MLYFKLISLTYIIQAFLIIKNLPCPKSYNFLTHPIFKPSALISHNYVGGFAPINLPKRKFKKQAFYSFFGQNNNLFSFPHTLFKNFQQ